MEKAAQNNDDDDFELQMLENADLLDKLEQKSSTLKISVEKLLSTNNSDFLEKNSLETPSDFNFPYSPYSIQTDFMSKLFRTIETGRVGIFESPTGTGKSLSLLCSSLTWLRMDDERRQKEYDALLKERENSNSNKDDDWIQAFAEKEENFDKNRHFLEKCRRLREREIELNRWKKEYNSSKNYRSQFQKRKISAGKSTSDFDKEESDLDEEEKFVCEDENFILDDYNSDNENKISTTTTTTNIDGDETETVDTPKIIYCSRTHSQLAQFLNEIKKTKFSKDVRCVTLGSRQTFCVNETVRKLQQINLINDRCLQLQKDKTEKSTKKGKLDSNEEKSSKKGCPFRKQNTIEEFSNSILLNGIRDLENLVSEGKETKSCPYYASRRAIAGAHLILMPYQILFHRATREACGLKLEGNILIIDEAHNLLDTLSSIHSTEVNILQLESGRLQLEKYLNRFSSRLNPRNLMYIRQLANILDSLIDRLKKANGETIFSLTDFVFYAGIDTFNIFKILRFMETSHISQKLNAYSNKFLQESSIKNENRSTDQSIGSSTIAFSPFFSVESFLRCLVQKSEDGRIILSPPSTIIDRPKSIDKSKYAKLKFIHLNPSIYFKDLCSSFKSIILAGGTMEPVSDLIDQLFTPCQIGPERIDRFSCGHVIDDENLLPLILDKGPSGVQFDFTFANRRDENQIRDLGRLLTNLANVVPGGIVCFFQSYDYESVVNEFWSKNGFWEQIEKKKKIFREPTRAADVNSILDNFTKHANNNSRGAIIFAVVGGKLSEGINFGDDLGRMVLMVGLPYANSNSVELKEKMKFLNQKSGDNRKGQQYYENLCMKAVNQSIGRVIRHKDDYAAIVLLDKGYAKTAIQKKLPQWIGKLVKSNDSFGTCFGKVKQFFTRMNLKYP